jgi:hypothetical protein
MRLQLPLRVDALKSMTPYYPDVTPEIHQLN